ncbi:MAG TPA: chemotaxis response regulator protein-glutamate methylesterase [Cyanobacteria bacterium UBA11149]|nr:chemotaxis response regulator protein-glutamate methylesterase [Cyanobacteria bacterium UBA11367]HBE58403.1 chemotaxis response regulator protein-glutamate methylesterase [Cyanobacteria bacterium UBA11366]HBK62717.1 chemotaxis response regulator protein-glutamate methylesterase [Cyanobacteria bacterium UBA11166]HBR75159.1 chemotaxis response regulator protein-glutamate methylesterase [Cyanobacteria bacterium UBA11159]HBS69717.1 chemotaxis response regulator protein-glutamate methylesterase [
MPIRVLLVEDSRISLTLLKRILNSSPDIQVVGEARTGLEALPLIPQLNPDVICTDLHMPQMNGLELTSEVMATYPRPILVISASVQEDDTHHVFQLLEAGAVDIFPKPRAGMLADDEVFKRHLIEKIHVIAGVKVLTKRRKFPVSLEPGKFHKFSSNIYAKPKIIAIGASTGGPQALQELFSHLPSDLSVPVICVQHICHGFLQGLIDWLSHSCTLPIEIAQHGEIPKQGIIYFPPEQKHLELDKNGKFFCHNEANIEGHRPSVTVTFNSVAKFYGRKAVGVLLTGMGRDGAKGMEALAEAGACTIAQDEATSVIFGMPKEAIELGAAREVLPIGSIAHFLVDMLGG